MKAETKILAVRTLSLAVRGAVAALAAMPLVTLAEGDEDVAALTNPTNTVDIAVGNNSANSAKFGEYSGLKKDGVNFDGGFNLRGGDAYGQGSGTTRWSITGSNLGTTSREVGASVGSQGSWSLGINYDELRHNITDTYQTPAQGSVGGNSFIIPQAFGVVSTFRPATALPYGTQVLTSGPTGQQSFFHTEDIHTDRKTTTLTGGVNFDRDWSVKVELSHLEQSGAKLMGFSTDGNIGAPGNSLTGYAPGKEAILILPNPTNYTTDNLNVSLNWVGEKGYVTGAYFGSRFRDGYSSVDFSNPYTSTHVANGSSLGVPFPVNTMSTMPDNDYHQLNLTGGFAFTPTTKLTGGLSYGRNTQNVPYINADQMQAGGLPQSSLSGLVVNTHADLKLTNRTTKDLTLTAGVKYNERDNRTSAAIYKFNDLGAAPETSVSAPMSNKKTQVELAADYRIDPRQALHAGYEYERIDRWCNDPLSNDARGSLSGTNAGYYTTASCVQMPETNENKGVAVYRFRLNDDLSLNAGYSYARRKADINASFYNPIQANSEGFENYGYRAYFDASRIEQQAKASVNWQVTSRLNLSFSGRYLFDNYDESPLGVQMGHGASANIDATYALGEKRSISAYATSQHRTRDLLTANGRNAVAPLSTLWTNTLQDDDLSLGLRARDAGLMGGRLDVVADLSYSLAKTSYSTQTNYATSTCTTPNNAGLVCGQLPDIRSELVRFRLTGAFDVDKHNRIMLGYLFQHLNSNDYFYNYYQMGYTGTTTLPTNQLTPNYRENRVFAVYTYSFR